MADTKGKAGSASGMNVDTAIVRELAELLAETGLTEIEVEDGNRKVRVARGGVSYTASAPAPAAPAGAAASSPPPASVAPETETAPAAPPANALKSTMVGTVYLAPEPGSPDFVKVGDAVKEGQTLVIVEAMKVMNPITADRAGTVQSILVENAQPVEYDQPLIVIA